jgi:hypothetical protein
MLIAMKYLLLTCLLLLPSLVGAVICKTIEDDGSVSYADVPASECPEQVKLPPYSSYTPRQVQQPAPAESDASGSLVEFEKYTALRFVQPERNGTVRNNDGIVPIVLVSEPGFQNGHQLLLTLDGKRVPGQFAGLSVALNNVDRGTHTLRAAIVDAGGRRLIESESVRFTLRRTGLNDGSARPEQPVAPQPPGFNPPAGGADYSPSGPANYNTGRGSGQSPAGGAGNAFRPNFGTR